MEAYKGKLQFSSSSDRAIKWQKGKKRIPETNVPRIFNDHYFVNQSQNNFLWVDELEKRFTIVINQLGLKRYPTEILYHMNVTGLSCKQVASHLQKLRDKQKDRPQKVKYKLGEAQPPQTQDYGIIYDSYLYMYFSVCGSISNYSCTTSFVPVM